MRKSTERFAHSLDAVLDAGDDLTTVALDAGLPVTAI